MRVQLFPLSLHSLTGGWGRRQETGGGKYLPLNQPLRAAWVSLQAPSWCIHFGIVHLKHTHSQMYTHIPQSPPTPYTHTCTHNTNASCLSQSLLRMQMVFHLHHYPRSKGSPWPQVPKTQPQACFAGIPRLFREFDRTELTETGGTECRIMFI